MRVYRSYRKLPESVRAPARWTLTPRWQTAAMIVRSKSGGQVMSGPFKGMKVKLSTVSSRNLLGYLLGTQEMELWGVVDQIIKRGYRTLINVGVADGYYAIGLARLMPTLEVVGFEALAYHHPLIKEAAAANGVGDRIRIEGFCNEADLTRELDAAANPALVLCDIEGGEAHLLDPEAVPGLLKSDILVETHETYAPGCTMSLIDRFSASHNVVLLKARRRTTGDFPKDKIGWLASAMPETAVGLMDERRVEQQQWLYLVAKGS
jgi:hypothetical protein